MRHVTRDALCEVSLQHKEQLVESSELNIPGARLRSESRGASAAAAQLSSAAAQLGSPPDAL